MSCNLPAILVKNLSKCYHIYDSPRARLKQFIIPNFKKLMRISDDKRYFREFWSVTDVSFEIKKGETIGIIGNNGAGKSTILQMICGTLNPTSGYVEVNGRIAALLELGSGFNMEFTGKENVYLNAAVLGLNKKEIDEKYQEIVDFADIKEFMDQPVKTYSSGMVARLAFSVAVQVNPDILIVDEALSVGDMSFQEKSFTKMKEIRDKGTSILFVSHSLSAVRNFCDSAIWMQKGKVRMIGERLDVCDAYQQESEGTKIPVFNPHAQNQTNTLLKTDQKIILNSVTCSKDNYNMGDDIILTFKLKFNESNLKYGLGIVIYDSKGNIISIINTLRDGILLSQEKENIKLIIKDNHFGPGKYSITASISDELGMFPYDKLEFVSSFKINMERNKAGLALVDGVLRCDHEWEGV